MRVMGAPLRHLLQAAAAVGLDAHICQPLPQHIHIDAQLLEIRPAAWLLHFGKSCCC